MQANPVDPVPSAPSSGGSSRACRSQRNEKGQALIGVVISISLMLLILLVAISITQFSNQAMARQLIYEGQALNAAEAGITDSLSWFRRQNGVVTAFAPLATDSECPTTGTGCPNAGIVRTFVVSQPGNLQGRYEAVIGVANGTTGVTDVTAQTQGNGVAAGTVWQLESTGYIWVVNDPTKKFNQSPNMILSKETVRTQIQRLTVNLPQLPGAAVFAGGKAAITLGARSKIKGGAGYAMAYSGTNVPTENGSITAGTAGSVYANSAALYGITNVFGVTQAQLMSLADVTYTRMQDVPNPLPAMSLVIYNGNATFTASQPLLGSGILVVLGNLSISGITNSNYNGVIYVLGSFNMDNPSSVDGAIIANASGTTACSPCVPVTIGNGAGSDIAEVDFDTNIITQINKQMGQYRFTRGMAWVGK